MAFTFIVPVPWTDERVQRLKELWARGWSGSQIAHDLGVTRNSVIGKVHRLGLSERQTTKPAVRVKSKPLRIRLNSPPKPRLVIPEPEPMSVCGPITLMELSDKSCRYCVTDDSPFMFCGAPSYEHFPYCAYHCSKAYEAYRPLTPAELETRRRAMAKMRRGLAA